MADWRQPLGVFNIRESGTGLSLGDESVTHADIADPRDAWMLDNGQACPNCWLTFPARPMASNLKEFEPHLHMWADGEGERRVAKARIRNGCCPVCRYPIKPEADTTWVQAELPNRMPGE